MQEDTNNPGAGRYLDYLLHGESTPARRVYRAIGSMSSEEGIKSKEGEEYADACIDGEATTLSCERVGEEIPSPMGQQGCCSCLSCSSATGSGTSNSLL